MKNNKLKKCKYCGAEIPSGKNICPSCNKNQWNKAWAIALIIFAVSGIAMQFQNSDPHNENTQGVETEQRSSDTNDGIMEFNTEDHHMVNSILLCENSEYYSEENIVTIVAVSDSSGKTLYAKAFEDEEYSIYCRLENKKEIKGLQEGDVVCVAGTVQSNQKTGKVVELESCHILAVGDECENFSEQIKDGENAQNEYILSKKQDKIHDIVKMDEKYIENFYRACEDCGIDVFEIKDYQKLNRWENGERYSFSYGGNTHNVYLLDSGEVDSINYCQSTSIKLYENGYESLNIEDFVIDAGTLSSLQVASEAVVKQSLNYPDSANFDWWTTGSYSRIYDYYILTAEFSAKNAFGMKDRHRFRIDCTYSEENGSSLVYYELDGAAQAGKPEVPEINKIPIGN